MGKDLHRRMGSRLRRLAAVAVACTALASQTGCRAEIPWPVWQQYKAKFIDGSGRVIDHDSGDRTTSEGMAYAMFFALVVNDRGTFEKALKWTEDNLAGGDLTSRLPAWDWGKSPAGEWKTLDDNSASDADLWMAYDLLEGGRLWKDQRLNKLGLVMADRIAHSEVALVPGVGSVLLPGPHGFQTSPSSFILNPSYSPPQLLARFKAEQPGGPWGGMLESFPTLLQGSSPGGFAMDWITAGNGIEAIPAPAEFAAGKTGGVGVGSYDAIRVYLWLGMADSSTEAVEDSLHAMDGMSRYMSINMVPPLQVDKNGHALNTEGTVGFSAAVIPFLDAVGSKTAAKAQMNRLDASLNPETKLYGRGTMYYDQNLAMFATGWREGRFRFDRDGRLRVKWK